MEENAPQSLIQLNLEYAFEGHQKKMSITMSQGAMWNITEAVVLAGDEAAFHIANFGTNIAYAIGKVETPQSVPTEEQIIIGTAITVVVEHFLGRTWNTIEDRALAFAYHSLQSGGGRAGAPSWSDMADFASRVLGREIKVDTFRKWLNRWAKDNGLPQVQLYKRRNGETEK